MYQNTNNNYHNNGYEMQMTNDDNLAIASFVLGIISIFAGGTVISIVGIVLEIISCNRKPKTMIKKSTNLAIVGIILSIISFIIWTYIIIFGIIALYYIYHAVINYMNELLADIRTYFSTCG